MADLKIGTTRPSKVYLGTTAVKKIYIGSTLLWSSGPTWDELFNNFDYAHAIESDFADIGFDVLDNSIHEEDDSNFAVLMPEYLQEEEICYWNWYDKSTYSSLLSDLSGFTYLGSFNDYDWYNLDSYLTVGKNYIVIPILYDEPDEEGCMGEIRLYEWNG